MTSIPSRFSEANFRRYEPAITAAITNPPFEVDCVALGLMPTTVAARLRDAALAYQRFHYESYGFTKAEFDAAWPKLEVSLQDTRVIIRVRGQRQQLSLTKQETPQEFAMGELDEKMSQSEVQAFALLLTTGRLNGRVYIAGWTREELDDFLANVPHDCSVIDEDGKLYII